MGVVALGKRRAARWSGFAAATCTLSLAGAAALAAPGGDPPQPDQGDVRAACLSKHEAGQVSRNEGKLLEAREAFLACSRPECPEGPRADCAGWYSEVSESIPSVVVSVRQGKRDLVDVSVTVDGTPFQPSIDGRTREIDPGRHRFSIAVPNQPTIDRDVVISAGEKGRLLAFELPSPEEPHGPVGPERQPPVEVPMVRPVPIATWVLVGVTAGALVAGGVTGGIALSARSSLTKPIANGGCAPFCSDAQVSPIRTKAIAADILFGVSGAAAVAALVTFLVRPSVPLHPTKAAHASFDFGASPSGGFVGARVAF